MFAMRVIVRGRVAAAAAPTTARWPGPRCAMPGWSGRGCRRSYNRAWPGWDCSGFGRRAGRPDRGRRRSGLSCRQAMFVVRAVAVIEDQLQGRKIRRIGVQPGIDMVGLDRHDAAVMARRSDLGGRRIGDRGE